MALEMTDVYRILKTAALAYSYICLGLYSEIIGPSLPDLRAQLGLSHEQLSGALTAEAAGMFAGAVLGGFLTDHFAHHRSALLSATLMLAAAAVAGVPFASMLSQLTTAQLCLGSVHGFQAANVGPAVVDLWNRRSTGPLNLIHAGYFVGFSLAPVILAAFHTDPAGFHDKNNTAFNSSVNLQTRDMTFLQNAFAFTAGLCALGAVIFAIIASVERCFGRRHRRSTATPKRTTSCCVRLATYCREMRHTRYSLNHLLLLLLLFLLYFSSLGGDRLFGRYIYTFVAKSDLHMARGRAYLFNMLIGVSYACARLLITVLTGWVSAEVLFVCEAAGAALFSTLLFFVTGTSSNYMGFWCLAVAFCLFKGPTHPTGIGVFNRYMVITGKVQLVINAGAGFGSMTLQWVCGHFLDVAGYGAFLIILVVNSVITLCLGILLICVGRRQAKSRAVCEELALEGIEITEKLTDTGKDPKVKG